MKACEVNSNNPTGVCLGGGEEKRHHYHPLSIEYDSNTSNTKNCMKMFVYTVRLMKDVNMGCVLNHIQSSNYTARITYIQSTLV